MFCIELAGIPIALDNRFDFVYRQCVGYYTKIEPKFTVNADNKTLETERRVSERTHGKVYSDGYLESICLYRAICSILPTYGVFLFHSAVVEKDGFAYAFVGRSGAGKSTHAQFWHEALHAQYINGDKPLFRFMNNQVYAFGTPWAGKENLQKNISAPIKALCEIVKAEENKIIRLSAYEAVPVLMNQLLLPESTDNLENTLDLADRMLSAVPVFRLYCKKDVRSAILAYTYIRSECL